jgi:hypothetical protein
MIIGRSQDGINLSQRDHPGIARRFNAGNAKGVPSLSPGLRGSATLGARPPALNPERVASVPHSCTIFLSPLQLRQNRPERPSHDSLGQRPGYGAMMAIKRCKRATTPALTRRHSNLVAQTKKPGAFQPSLRDVVGSAPQPGVETPGYCQTSLQDAKTPMPRLRSWNGLGADFYKDAAPTALGICRADKMRSAGKSLTKR